MMKVLTLTIASAALFSAGAANANFAYMTGTSAPWGQVTNEAAMDAAFGAGNWTASYGFDAGVFTGNQFIFFDGGDGAATEFGDFITANSAAFGSFLSGGGRVLVHAAPNQTVYASYPLPGGLTLDGIGDFDYPTASGTGELTAAGVAAGLGANGAGTSFTGNSFAHNNVTGGTCLITGDNGCVLASAVVGSGFILAGGETTSNFHSSDDGDPFQLRVNEIVFAANGVIPEPATWAMMILGFGLVGASLRRRAVAHA